MRAWNKLKFKQKLLLSYFLVFVVAMTALAGYAVSTSRRYMYENNRATLAGMVEKVGANFNMKLEQYEQSITICAYQKELQNLYANRFISYYDLYVKLSDLFTPLYLGVCTSHSDEVIALYLYSTMGLNAFGSYMRNAKSVEDEAFFIQGMNEGGIKWHLNDGALYATCRVDPISRLYGRNPLGLIYFEVNTTIFMPRYALLDWPEYAFNVLDANGNVLYTHGRNAPGDTLTLRAKIPKSGWTLEYHIPMRTLYGNGFEFVAGGAMVLLASAVVLLILFAAFSRALMKGLSQLHSGILRVREGDLNVYMRSDSEDEIGALTNAFSDMLARVRELIEQTKQNERRMSDLEYRSLRTQIDPHFLYNTLSFIRWKCLKAGQEDVSRVVEQLSMFYRTCLNKGGDLTDVQSEMFNIRAYAEIQLQLHDHSFDIIYDIPPELMSRRMPCFVLQPLLENAILHGVEPLRARRGEICISLREEADSLVFRVTDNGNGVDMATINEIMKPGKSCGISNVHERIVLIAGEKYGFGIRNLPAFGCEATLTLPVLYAQ